MNNRGFSLIEMIVVMGIVAILFALTVPQLFRLRDRSVLQNTTIKLLADIRSQQLKAMNTGRVGGIHFDASGYSQFDGMQFDVSDGTNTTFQLDFPVGITSINVPDNSILYSSGSGEILGYDSENNSITLEDTVHHETHVIQFNSLGVPIE